MKRTDKYRDSYQYDNQNQNHRRQSEDALDNNMQAILIDYRREQILEEEKEIPPLVVIYHY